MCIRDSGWGADVGTFYTTGWKRINIGMVIQNFGPDMKFVSTPFPLPMSFKFGLSMLALDRPTYNLLLAMEFIHPNDNLELYHFGAELRVKRLICLRLGKRVNGWKRDSWEAYQEDEQKDPFIEYPLFELDGFSFGAGLMIPQAGVNVDYAWAGLGTLGSVHRFSIGYMLGNLLR